jgi:hypothetical protein
MMGWGQGGLEDYMASPQGATWTQNATLGAMSTETSQTSQKIIVVLKVVIL